MIYEIILNLNQKVGNNYKKNEIFFRTVAVLEDYFPGVYTTILYVYTAVRYYP